jgi:hypothetical protein
MKRVVEGSFILFGKIMLAQTIGSNPKTSVNDQKNVSLQVDQRIYMSGFHFSLLNGMFSTSQMISKEVILCKLNKEFI